MKRLLVINPNSNVSVTRGMTVALESYCEPQNIHIDCVELAGAPFGIESENDIKTVIPLLVEKVTTNLGHYDAFVIACYSDPGLEECRALSNKPVVGIHASAVQLAAKTAQGEFQKFGVLALGQASIDRHIAYVKQLGFIDNHVGEIALNVTVDQAANDPATLNKVLAASKQLIKEKGAESIVLGCAGMATHRQAAEKHLRVNVIDPVQAGVVIALKAI